MQFSQLTILNGSTEFLFTKSVFVKMFHQLNF